jgi:hypothetical protein
MQPPPFAPPPGGPPVGGAPPAGAFVPPPPGTYGGPVAPPSKPVSTEAIMALVLGVVTLSSSCFPMGFAAVWLGMKARKKAAEEKDTGDNPKLALVGMIMGGTFGVLWLLFWLLEVGFLIFVGGFWIFGGP